MSISMKVCSHFRAIASSAGQMYLVYFKLKQISCMSYTALETPATLIIWFRFLLKREYF
jgi:hypothetical protein